MTSITEFARYGESSVRHFPVRRPKSEILENPSARKTHQTRTNHKWTERILKRKIGDSV